MQTSNLKCRNIVLFDSNYFVIICTYLICFCLLIAIKWKTNAALSRPTTSSSVYGSDISVWGAHFATNGAISAIFSEIFASDYEMYPWLKVQLIGSKMITFVRVYNRRDKVGK